MVNKVKIRNQLVEDADEWSDANGLACNDPSLALQSQADEADINTIVRRFGLTGAMPTDVRAPMFGDFTEVHDYKSALIALREAEASFMRMPAEVRARFQNDPQRFVEFCSDEKNGEEMLKMGLRTPAPEPPVDKPA